MKKLFTLLAYAAGVVVGAKYATKKTKKTSTSPEASLSDKAIDAGKDLLETHKQVFEDLKNEYWTEENKQLLANKKEDLMHFFDLAKTEIAQTVKELKEQGLAKTDIDEKIQSIYDEKKTLLEKLGATPAVQSAKKKIAALSSKK